MNKRKFAVQNATDSVPEILEKTHFQLSPEQWKDVVAILDAPAQPDFALARLLNSPAPRDRKQRSKSAYNGKCISCPVMLSGVSYSRLVVRPGMEFAGGKHV